MYVSMWQRILYLGLALVLAVGALTTPSVKRDILRKLYSLRIKLGRRGKREPSYHEWLEQLEEVRAGLLPVIRGISLGPICHWEELRYTIFAKHAKWGVDCELTKLKAAKVSGAFLTARFYNSHVREVGVARREVWGILDHQGNWTLMEYDLLLVRLGEYESQHWYEVTGFRIREVSLDLMIQECSSIARCEHIMEALDQVFVRAIRSKEDGLERLRTTRQKVVVSRAQTMSDRGVRFYSCELRQQLVAPVR